LDTEYIYITDKTFKNIIQHLLGKGQRWEFLKITRKCKMKKLTTPMKSEVYVGGGGVVACNSLT
jgi:hypothetical protein